MRSSYERTRSSADISASVPERWRPYRALLLLGLIAVTGGCQNFIESYRPRVTVGLSPEPIQLRVEVRNLRDASPAQDRDPSLLFGGSVATTAETLQGDLSGRVTNAIRENLELDEVFAEVSTEPKAADLVMSGTIRRFYAKAHENLGLLTALLPFGMGTYVMYLGFPLFSSYGQVDLELTFDTPAGERVAAYSASREFSEWASMYWAPQYAIGARLNQIFSQVMVDVREQMLADRVRLLESRAAVLASGRGPDPDPEKQP